MLARLPLWLRQWTKLRSHKIIRVSGVQPLASGVTVYALDIDGRRIIVGASSHTVCVLDRYPQASGQSAASEGADSVGA